MISFLHFIGNIYSWGQSPKIRFIQWWNLASFWVICSSCTSFMVSFLPYTCSLSWFVNYLPNCIEKRYLSNINNCSEVANSSHESTCLTPYIPPYQKVKLITGALLGINQCVSQRPTIVIKLESKNSRTRLYLGPIIFLNTIFVSTFVINYSSTC